MGEEWKPIPVSSSALIQVGGTHLCDMCSVDDVQNEVMKAPAFHSAAMRGLIASGTIRDDGSHTELEISANAGREPKLRTFGNGAIVKDHARKLKGTIIHANAGYTKKTHTPVHRVAARNGDSWLAKQSDLELLL